MFPQHGLQPCVAIRGFYVSTDLEFSSFCFHGRTESSPQPTQDNVLTEVVVGMELSSSSVSPSHGRLNL